MECRSSTKYQVCPAYHRWHRAQRRCHPFEIFSQGQGARPGVMTGGCTLSSMSRLPSSGGLYDLWKMIPPYDQSYSFFPCHFGRNGATGPAREADSLYTCIFEASRSDLFFPYLCVLAGDTTCQTLGYRPESVKDGHPHPPLAASSARVALSTMHINSSNATLSIEKQPPLVLIFSSVASSKTSLVFYSHIKSTPLVFLTSI